MRLYYFTTERFGLEAIRDSRLKIARVNELNDAQVLFLTDGATSEELADFERCAVLFDGNDDTAASAARTQWTALKDAGHDLTYWQQNDEGKWEKKD